MTFDASGSVRNESKTAVIIHRAPNWLPCSKFVYSDLQLVSGRPPFGTPTRDVTPACGVDALSSLFLLPPEWFRTKKRSEIVSQLKSKIKKTKRKYKNFKKLARKRKIRAFDGPAIFFRNKKCVSLKVLTREIPRPRKLKLLLGINRKNVRKLSRTPVAVGRRRKLVSPGNFPK